MVIAKGGLWIGDPFYESALIKALALTGITFDFSSFDRGFEGSCSFFLVDEEYRGRQELSGLKNVFFLTENPAGTGDMDIFKYEDGWTMAGIIGEHLGIGGGPVENSVVKIGVFAGEGGVGTTSVAMGLAVQLSRQLGCKPLYLSLCPYNFRGFAREVFSEGKGDFTKLIYYLSKGRKLPLQAFTLDMNEFYAVNTGSFNPMWWDFDLKVLKNLEKLSEDFGYIICDFGNNVGIHTQELMDYMDRAVFVAEKEGVPVGLQVRNPINVYLWDEEVDEEEVEAVYLPKVENFDMESLNYDYGNQLLNLVKMVGEGVE